MPQRAAGILIALFGLLAVVSLFLIGLDARAASRRGPRWTRRLLGAGLALLAMLGIGPGCGPRPTCYVVVSFPATVVLQRLPGRLAALEKAVAAEKLDLMVAGKLLAAAERDLANLSDRRKRREMSAAERRQADAFLPGARERIVRIRGRLRGKGFRLENTSEWKEFRTAFYEAVSVTYGPGPFEKAKDKARLLEAVRKAGLHTDKLRGASLLTPAEAALLDMDLRWMEVEISNRKAEDLQFGPTVGRPPSVRVQAWRGYRACAARLTQRLPLLRGLPESKNLHLDAVRTILLVVGADLGVLLDRLPDGLSRIERRGILRIRKEASAVVLRLEAMVRRPGPTCYRPIWEAPEMQQREPRSAAELERDLARLESLQRAGHLDAAVVEKVRRRIAGESARAGS